MRSQTMRRGDSDKFNEALSNAMYSSQINPIKPRLSMRSFSTQLSKEEQKEAIIQA